MTTNEACTADDENTLPREFHDLSPLTKLFETY
jgi:hypothetical protein